jgi:hypothetical protein
MRWISRGQYVEVERASRRNQRVTASFANAVVSVAIARSSSVVDETVACVGHRRTLGRRQSRSDLVGVRAAEPNTVSSTQARFR